tara:strand:- start:5618 stop:5830 length:213 start_codon:yes stop_codon:yes gene_type:complete
MRFYNPAIVAYKNMDLDRILPKETAEPKSGLLAPRKTMTQKMQSDKLSPVLVVANHMKVIRDKRNMINES